MTEKDSNQDQLKKKATKSVVAKEFVVRYRQKGIQLRKETDEAVQQSLKKLEDKYREQK